MTTDSIACVVTLRKVECLKSECMRARDQPLRTSATAWFLRPFLPVTPGHPVGWLPFCFDMVLTDWLSTNVHQS